MFPSGITRVSARVCSKFSKRVQLKLKEIAVKRYKTNGKRHAVLYWVMNALGRLLSTQEAWVALDYRPMRLLRFFRA